MLSPKVIELPKQLEPISPDTFINAVGVSALAGTRRMDTAPLPQRPQLQVIAGGAGQVAMRRVVAG